MSVGIHLRSQKRMSFVIDACYHMTCGDFEDFLHVVSADGVQMLSNKGGRTWLSRVTTVRDWATATTFPDLGTRTPSPSTLSRARFKLDAFLMLVRRQQWKLYGEDSMVISLGANSHWVLSSDCHWVHSNFDPVMHLWSSAHHKRLWFFEVNGKSKHDIHTLVV